MKIIGTEQEITAIINALPQMNGEWDCRSDGVVSGGMIGCYQGINIFVETEDSNNPNNSLNRENKILRAEIKEQAEVIESIATIINLFRREGYAVASYPDDKGRLELCEELEEKFPCSK